MTAAFCSEACRLYLLVVLLASATGKARAPGRFAGTLEVLLHLPARWSRGAAVAITATEFLVALTLVLGDAVFRPGMAAALGLFLAFSAVLLVALVQRQTVSCNCFGTDDHPISAWDLGRNLWMISASVAGLVLGPPTEAPPVAMRLLALGVAGLAFGVSTNLRGLAAWLSPTRRSESVEPPLTVPLGQPVPAFEGRARASGRRVRSEELEGQAAVLLFMSSGCPKCRGKVAELLRLLPSIHGAGLGFWIVPADSTHEISLLLEDPALMEHVLLLEPAVRERLNPRGAAPLYLFIDHRMVALASGQVGDDDWMSFVAQMDGLASGAGS